MRKRFPGVVNFLLFVFRSGPSFPLHDGALPGRMGKRKERANRGVSSFRFFSRLLFPRLCFLSPSSPILARFAFSFFMPQSYAGPGNLFGRKGPKISILPILPSQEHKMHKPVDWVVWDETFF